MRSCAEAWWATGARTYRPYQCTLIAEASRDVDPDAGFELLADVEAEMATSNERWAEAELHRVRGELHLASGDRDKAEASFVEALAVADGQDAKMWGLRAAVSLAELWSTNGRSSDAMALVAPRRSWFSECLDSHDVRRADRLLSRLASD
jgi:predicted ATPase